MPRTLRDEERPPSPKLGADVESSLGGSTPLDGTRLSLMDRGHPGLAAGHGRRFAALCRTLTLAGALALLLQSGCVYQRMTIGDGPRGGEVTPLRTWYAFWGFLPVNPKDSREFVGPADDYQITTWYSASDVLLNVFTIPFSFMRRSTLIEQ